MTFESLNFELFLVISIAYFLVNGLNQYSCLYIILLGNGLMFFHYIQLDNWYSITSFIISILAVILAIAMIWLSNLDYENDVFISIVSLFGVIPVIITFLIKGNFPELIGNRLSFFGGYLIIAIYSIINNKQLLFTLVPIAGTVYACYYLYPHSWMSVAYVLFMAFASMQTYLLISAIYKRIYSLASKANNLEAKIAELSSRYQNLECRYNALLNERSRTNHPEIKDNTDWGNEMGKGMVREVGRKIIDFLIRIMGA